MRNGHEKKKSVEEKQPSSFPSLPGPKAVFPGKIKDFGLLATLLNYINPFI